MRYQPVPNFDLYIFVLYFYFFIELYSIFPNFLRFFIFFLLFTFEKNWNSTYTFRSTERKRKLFHCYGYACTQERQSSKHGGNHKSKKQLTLSFRKIG